MYALFHAHIRDVSKGLSQKIQWSLNLIVFLDSPVEAFDESKLRSLKSQNTGAQSDIHGRLEPVSYKCLK